MRDLLQRRCAPTPSNDIIATNALYRPGPLEGGMVDDLRRSEARPQAGCLSHPIIDEVSPRHLRRDGLPGTGDADSQPAGRHRAGLRLYKCIKAISKKKLPIIAKFREQFIEGAKKRDSIEARRSSCSA